MPSPDLIAHWPLKENANDVVGSNDGASRNVVYGAGAGGSAQFNGRDSVIEIPDNEALRLGNRDFSIAVWTRCDVPMRSVFGDILSKFDPVGRYGVNLHIAGSSPAYCSMSDTRHVHFGIDDGYLGPWEDHGRPWPSNPLLSHLIVLDGELYTSTSDADDPMNAAKVFRWGGGDEWIDCGRLGENPNHLSVQSMIVHDDALYAGTGVWDWVRAGGGVQGFEPGLSHVFRYEGGTTWHDLGQVGESVRVLCMASFDGQLYAGLDRAGGGHCFRLDGDEWIDCGAPNGDNFENLIPLAGTLYGNTHSMLYRYEGGQSWTCIGDHPHDIRQIHATQVYRGQLHYGTWPQGYVLRYEEPGACRTGECSTAAPGCAAEHGRATGEELGRDAQATWINTGRLGIPEGLREINEINDLTVYNGKLYAGVIPKAQVYRYEADGHWTLLGSLASRPDWREDSCPTWCRVTSLTSFQGRLFACTGVCQARAIDIDSEQTVGRVYSCQAGQVVSHERDIGGEWTHIAAVREGKELRLYIDGTLSAASHAPARVTLDLTNTQPLRIGFGEQNYFSGAIADVRLYSGALDAQQIARIASERRGL